MSNREFDERDIEKEYLLTDLFHLYHTKLDYRVLSKITVMKDQKSYDRWFYKVTYIENGGKDQTISPSRIAVDALNNIIYCKSLDSDKVISFSDIKSIDINHSSCLKRFIKHVYVPEKSCLRIKTSVFSAKESIGTYLSLSEKSGSGERDYIRILTKDGIREIFLNYIDSVEDYDALVDNEFESMKEEEKKSIHLESELSEYETKAELVERQFQENCKELNNCFKKMEEQGFSINQALPFTGADGFYYLVIGKRKRKVN